MNKLTGNISKITSSGELSLVEVQISEDTLSSVIISERSEFLQPGNEVDLLFKETEVVLGVNFSGSISFRNQLPCKVTQLVKGAVLTSVKLNYRGNALTSIITTASAELLGLTPGISVTAFIKTNELMLMKPD